MRAVENVGVAVDGAGSIANSAAVDAVVRRSSRRRRAAAGQS